MVVEYFKLKYQKGISNPIYKEIEPKRSYIVFSLNQATFLVNFIKFNDNGSDVTSKLRILLNDIPLSLGYIEKSDEFIFFNFNADYESIFNKLVSKLGNVNRLSLYEELDIYKKSGILEEDSIGANYFSSVYFFLIGDRINAIKKIDICISKLRNEIIVLDHLKKISSIISSNKNGIHLNYKVVYSCHDQIDYDQFEAFNILLKILDNNSKNKIFRSNGSNFKSLINFINSSSENCIIFIVGHGNSKKGLRINFATNSSKIPSTFIDSNFLNNSIDNSNLSGLVLFCCYGQYYYNINKSSYNIASSQGGISFQHADPFIVGFIREFGMNFNFADSFLMGKYALSCQARDYDNFRVH